MSSLILSDRFAVQTLLPASVNMCQKLSPLFKKSWITATHTRQKGPSTLTQTPSMATMDTTTQNSFPGHAVILRSWRNPKARLASSSRENVLPPTLLSGKLRNLESRLGTRPGDLGDLGGTLSAQSWQARCWATAWICIPEVSIWRFR